MNNVYKLFVIVVILSISSLGARGKGPCRKIMPAMKTGTEDVPLVIKHENNTILRSLYGDKHGSVKIVGCQRFIIGDLCSILSEDDTTNRTLFLRVEDSDVVINDVTFPFERVVISVCRGSVTCKQRPATFIVVEECIDMSSIVATNNDSCRMYIFTRVICPESSLVTKGTGSIYIEKGPCPTRLAGMIYPNSTRTFVSAALRKLMYVAKVIL